MKFLNSAKIKDKRVLLRLDLNVPLDEEGKIIDDNRIKKSLPTINYILKQHPKQIIIISHLGRPKGKIISKLKTSTVILPGHGSSSTIGNELNNNEAFIKALQ